MIFSLNKGINKAPDTFVQAISDSMPRDTFERILQNLWFSNAELMAVATNKQQAHSSGI